MLFHVDAPQVTAEAVRAAAETRPDEATLFPDDERAQFTARVDSRLPVAHGDEVELAVHMKGLHFFDPDTGDVIEVGRARAMLAPDG